MGAANGRETDEERERSRREAWEARYREADRVWSGEPNAVLVDVASSLPPGRALDLGCGEGADTIWLASRGWQVTGIDISDTALERAAEAEAEAQVPTGRITWMGGDLATWHPETTYDLVSAFFLHSHAVEIPRTQILQRAAAAVSSGGHLLVVGHAEPPWEPGEDGDDGEHGDHEPHKEHGFLTPSEQVDQLNLPEDEWRVEVAETRRRTGRTPQGEPKEFDDVVVLMRRA